MKRQKMPRHLDFFSGFLLNIGTSVGTGAFIVQGILIQQLGSPGLVLLMIILGGLFAVIGTWAFVELGCMRPVSGGPKEYLEYFYPKPRAFMAFVFTMTSIFGVYPGKVAAGAIGCGTYLISAIFGTQDYVQVHNPFVYEYYDTLSRTVAGAAVIFITALHSLAPLYGIRIQSSLSVIKMIVVMLVIVIGMFAAANLIPGAPPQKNFDNAFQNSTTDINMIVSAFIKVLFLFEGWASINYSLDEFINPVQNLPYASFASIAVCFILTLGASASFFIVVPAANLANTTGGVIGQKFFSLTLGEVVGGKIVPALISLAAFSTVMCLCFTSSRLLFEAARDGYFHPKLCAYLGSKSPRFNSPMAALLFNCALSLVYIYAPPAGQAYTLLISITSYPQIIFYGLTVLGLLIMDLNLTRNVQMLHRPIQSSFAGKLAFIYVAFGLTVMSFYPPLTKEAIDFQKGTPYFIVPLFGLCVLFGASLWWYYQVIVHNGLEGSYNMQFAKKHQTKSRYEMLKKMKMVDLDKSQNYHHDRQKSTLTALTSEGKDLYCRFTK